MKVDINLAKKTQFLKVKALGRNKYTQRVFIREQVVLKSCKNWIVYENFSLVSFYTWINYNRIFLDI